MIGILDSGIGGLSVLRHVRQQIPEAGLLYVADQAMVPYGNRPFSEIRQLTEGICRFMLNEGATLIVVACNTASGAALTHLRQTWPNMPFVGMEPAVKPAVAKTNSGTVAVLATQRTLQSERYRSLLTRFAQDVTVLTDPCIGLVDLIEAGKMVDAEKLLRQIIPPLVAKGADTLVLGCTHYPFVMEQIQQAAGTAVSIIDPAPSVAKQTKRLWQKLNPEPGDGQVQLVTTGKAERLQQQVADLLGQTWRVKTAVWQTKPQRHLKWHEAALHRLT